MKIGTKVPVDGGRNFVEMFHALIVMTGRNIEALLCKGLSSVAIDDLVS